ncbi:MAG TPA: LptE family protein, partial [Thermoanaerobaculia bacterium]|nr:LptE family protein [Thermoanaerobaculia bacterium]
MTGQNSCEWPRRAPDSLPFKEIFLFFFLLGLLGCGYTLVGTGSSALPAGVKTVYVPTFINDTTVVGLEQRLTDAVIRELSVRGRLKPVSDRSAADSELSGRLTSCSVAPVRFDANGIAVEYQVTVSGKLVLIEKATDKL